MNRSLPRAAALSLLLTLPAAAAEVLFVEGKGPPPAEAGGEWCLITRPAATKTVTEQVLIRPETFYVEKIPARFEPQDQTVVVEPAKKREIYLPARFRTETVEELVEPEATEIRVIPAEYKTVRKTVVVTPERVDKVYMPPIYQTVSDRILVEPARSEQRPGKCPARKVSRCDPCADKPGNPEACYTTVDIPARYETVCRQVLKEEGYTLETTIPAVTKTIAVRELVAEARTETVKTPARYAKVERRIEVEPARFEFEDVPARTETIRKLVMVEPERERRMTVPAQYRTVSKEVVVRPAQLVWHLRPCDPCGAKDAAVLASGAAKGEESARKALEKYGSIPGMTTKKSRGR